MAAKGAEAPGPRVQRQIRLPLRKAAEIAMRSLQVRFGRSLLTFITIVMAIAFLTNVWTGNAVNRVVHNAVLAGQHLPPVQGAQTARLVWLLGLSLLVCLVGISNAMLMSVMERFREIGTMKCLGALDSFILKLFLLESIFLGAAGTIAGVATGLALTLCILALRYGAASMAYCPWGKLPPILLGCTAIGIAITAAAATYPAWKAARMEPIDAMRVEV